MRFNTKKSVLAIAVLLVLAGLACSACSSGTQMFKHRRSNCDCPEF